MIYFYSRNNNNNKKFPNYLGLECHSSRKFPDLPENAIDHLRRLNPTGSSVHFTSRIYEYLKSSSTPVTIVATGPLTNIALLLINYPNVTKYIKRFCLNFKKFIYKLIYLI